MPISDDDRDGEMIVRLARTPLPPGWQELQVDGLAGDLRADPMLRVFEDGAAAAAVDYALPAAGDGSLSLVFRSQVPIGRARLSLGGPGARGDAVLRPLSRLALLRRAWLLDGSVVLSAIRWRMLGKKVRSRNILQRLLGQPRRMSYLAWLARQQQPWAAEADALQRLQAVAEGRPGLDLLVHCRPGSAVSEATLASLARQIVRPDRIVIVGGSQPRPAAAQVSCLPATVTVASLAEAVATSNAAWIVVLPDGHMLSPDALLRVAAAATAAPAPAAIYWDSDALGADGLGCEPELKPQWNEALYLSRDYVGAFAASREAIGRGADAMPGVPRRLPDALLLAAARSGAGAIVRLPRILAHRVGPAGMPRRAGVPNEARRELVEAFVRTESRQALATAEPGGITRVVFPLPDPAPLVSLIVPTRDRLDLLQPCIAGLGQRTAYPSLEILIADNESAEPRTRAYFETIARDPRVRIIACPGSFNFAAINNRAVAAAQGQVLGFINNDIEVIGSGWLAEMVAHALRPRIGAVGARLIYASGLVQHAGVILGVGGFAGHAHRFAHPGDWGYLGRLQAQQHYAAVTAACLVVERDKFLAVGGFDAEAFPVAYNDVDLCLRLRAAGFQTLWTPYAELLHKESASRVKDYSAERRLDYDRESQALLDRWGSLVADDPCYHPALSRTQENFSLE